jgi:hypothetical protein
MKQRALRAFGYVIVQNDWDPGEIFSDDYCSNNTFTIEREIDSTLTVDRYSEKDFNHIWLVTSGRLDVTEAATGNVCTRGPGFCTVDVENQRGQLNVSIIQPTRLFCLSANRNLKRTPIIPSVKTFKLLSGEKYSDSNDVKLFLADGKIDMRGLTIEGPCQLLLASDREYTAVSDCYGLVFI